MTDRITFGTIFNQITKDIKELNNRCKYANTESDIVIFILCLITGALLHSFPLILSTTMVFLFYVCINFNTRYEFEKYRFKQHFYDRITYSIHYLDRNNEKIKLEDILNIFRKTKHTTFVTVRNFILDRDDVSYKIVYNKEKNMYKLNVIISDKVLCHFNLRHKSECYSLHHSNHSCTCNKYLGFVLYKNHSLYDKVNKMLYN